MAYLCYLSVFIFGLLSPCLAKELCTADRCQNGGTCVERYTGDPMCQCTTDYQGETCGDFNEGRGDCNVFVYNETNGVLTSPDYPAMYGNRLICLYMIYHPFARKVRVTFNDIDLETLKDELIMGKGPSPTIYADEFIANYSGRYNKNNLPRPLELETDIAWMALYTDKSNVETYRGFNVTFDIEIIHCSSYPCQNEGKCIDTVDGFHCDCESGYTGDTCDTKESTPTDITKVGLYIGIGIVGLLVLILIFYIIQRKTCKK